MVHSKQEKTKRKYRRLKRRFKQIAGVDIKIWLHKWYPWSYKNYVPTLVLQGWYDISKAKEYFIKKYGPNALKHIHFSKGKHILEAGGFQVGYSLYINGQYKVVNSKIYIPAEDKAEARGHSFGRWDFKYQSMETLKKRTRGHNDRVAYDKEVLYYTAERELPVSKLEKKERLRLQKVQETNRKRKKTLFEIPSDA